MRDNFVKYRHFTVTDFILDDDFINWVIDPVEENAVSWDEFISQNPLQEKNVADARLLINSLDTSGKNAPDEIKNRIWESIQSKSKHAKVIPIKRNKTWMVAASVIVIMLASYGYFYFNENAPQPIAKEEKPQKSIKNDVTPGGNKAVLTLADGSMIILDSAQNGTLSNQGNIKIIKLDDGQLAYDKSGVSGKPELLYNTISTPKGGQYQLTLSDGTQVWLNAASSLRFPAVFSGRERKVELTGEAYFEVAKNKEKPFEVSVNNAVVTVLGTHFNINAYSDERVVKTTLLEGSVKVTKGNAGALITPGEQARINNSTGEITVKEEVDLDEAVSWKYGNFIFNDADIKSIMRQLEKWYDVSVIYDKVVPDEEFVGSVSRNVNISQILEMLEKTGSVNFEIKGRTIIVD
jgi:ferric-dicitrate binding protein FerR (iron transport regulator)